MIWCHSAATEITLPISFLQCTLMWEGSTCTLENVPFMASSMRYLGTISKSEYCSWTASTVRAISVPCSGTRKKGCVCGKCYFWPFFLGGFHQSHVKFSAYSMPISRVTELVITGYSCRLLSTLCIMLCVNTFCCFLSDIVSVCWQLSFGNHSSYIYATSMQRWRYSFGWWFQYKWRHSGVMLQRSMENCVWYQLGQRECFGSLQTARTTYRQ